MAEVKADFSDNGNGVISTVNTSCIVNVTKVECLDTICRRVSHDYIITGGQDGVVRLWKVAVEDEDEEEDTKYSITKVKDLVTHTGAVMSVSYYSDEENQWAVSSSRDGGLPPRSPSSSFPKIFNPMNRLSFIMMFSMSRSN